MWNVSLALWLVFAIVVFWAVGVHNRLMRIRARAMDALGSFDKHVRNYRTLVTEHWQSVGVPAELLNGEADQNPLPPLWTELLMSLYRLEQHTKSARASVPDQGLLTSMAESLQELDKVWARLRVEPDELTGPVVPEMLRVQWEDNSRRVESARSGYNQINARFNEAIGQFPASLLATTLRFSPVGTL